MVYVLLCERYLAKTLVCNYSWYSPSTVYVWRLNNTSYYYDGVHLLINDNVSSKKATEICLCVQSSVFVSITYLPHVDKFWRMGHGYYNVHNDIDSQALLSRLYIQRWMHAANRIEQGLIRAQDWKASNDIRDIKLHILLLWLHSWTILWVCRLY